MDIINDAVSYLLSVPGNALHAVLRPVDSILNLPLVSVLLLPSVTSWSTSFNLLFFYVTWSTLLLSHSPLKVEFLGTIIIRLVFYVCPSLIFLAFDTLLPGLASNVKEHGKDGIATSESNGGSGKRGKWWRVVLLSLINLFGGTVLQVVLNWTLTSLLHLRSTLRITTALPLPWGVFKDLLGGFLLREALSYWTHRFILHDCSFPMSSAIKSYHQQLYHHLRTPLPFSAHFDHPLCYIIRVFVPTYVPACILRFHLLTYHLYLALISLEEVLVYSNYSALPGGFVIGGMARRIEKHLLAEGQGNYGSYGLADLIMGTSIGEDLIENIEMDAKKTDIPRETWRQSKRAKGKVSEAARGLRSQTVFKRAG